MIAASTLVDLLTSVLPFILLFGFWRFLIRQVRSRSTPGPDALVQKLDEIREELRRLREAVEQNGYSRR